MAHFFKSNPRLQKSFCANCPSTGVLLKPPTGGLLKSGLNPDQSYSLCQVTVTTKISLKNLNTSPCSQ